MIKVANIIEEGKLGGPQLRIMNVAKAIEKEVYTIVVLPSRESDNFIYKLKELNIPFQLFDISKITKDLKMAIRYTFLSIFEIFELKKYFLKENFDLIHVSGGSWQYKGVIAGFLARKKIVWHLNDTSMPYLFRKLFMFFSQFPIGFIYASQRSEEYYKPLQKMKNPKQSFVIQAPVNTYLFNPKINFNGDQSLINTFENKIVIGTMANINRIKGIEILILAASKLNKIYDNLVFLVVGKVHKNQRSYFNYLQKIIIKKNISNLQFVGQKDDVRPLLKRFDIYVCCSKFESSPTSVWEAMSMEKPVVSMDVGDVNKFIKENKSGFIIEGNKSEFLSLKISELIKNEKMRIKFGQLNRKIAIKNLDIKQCAANHVKAYNKLIYDEN